MRITYTGLSQGSAHLAFLALFPGFFFYQTAVELGTIPAFLGGFLSPVTVLLLPFLLVLYLRQLATKKLTRSPMDAVFFGFIACFLLVLTYQTAEKVDGQVLWNSWFSMLHLVIAFLIFRMADFMAAPWVRKASVVSLLAMAAIIFWFAQDGMFYLRSATDYVDDYLIDYQGFARSYLLTALVVLMFTHFRWQRLALYALSAAALYLNGARSEFVALAVAAVAIESASSKRKWMILGTIATIVLLVSIYLQDLVAMLPENRVLQLLNLDEASSWQQRSEGTEFALQTIQDHPLLGDFGSYVYLGGAGYYAHNILSAWVDLGFIGFAWLSIMVLWAVSSLTTEAMLRWRSIGPTFLLPFSLMVVSALLLVAAKQFGYLLWAAGLGAFTTYRAANPVQATVRTRATPHLARGT